jgi:uncharacterized Zn finger protein
MEMEDNADWKKSKCNCPVFFKNYICKHIVGMAIRLKYCKPPPAAKTVPVGEKRKRGRPAKANPAILVQIVRFSFSFFSFHSFHFYLMTP